tara:strand:- start:75 stop:752 length:678 start_codon:yes stop_codon:yes gene_type:complete
MSKKFLSESQIRRFQGLAGIPAITEMGGGFYGDRDEDELPGDEGPGEELPPDMGAEFGGDEDVEVTGLEVPDEGGEDLGLEPEQAQNLAADIVRAVAQELEGALGLSEPIEVEVEDEAGAAGGLEDLEDLGGDLGAPDLGGEEGGELDLGAPEEEEDELALQEDGKAGKMDRKDVANKASGRWLKEDEEESLEEGDDEELAEVIDDEEVVNEVLRRVVARLSGKK